MEFKRRHCAAGAAARVHSLRWRPLLVMAAALAGAMPHLAAQTLAEHCRLPAFARAVPVEALERGAAERHAELLARARTQRALAPDDHTQVRRARHLLSRLLPAAAECNARAVDWVWELHVVSGSAWAVTAFAHGKLLLPFGFLRDSQADDDELAFAIAQGMAEVLLEQERARRARSATTRQTLALGAAMMGLAASSAGMNNVSADLMERQYRRQQMLPADAVALHLMALAGYDPGAAMALLNRLAGMQAQATAARAAAVSAAASAPDAASAAAPALPSGRSSLLSDQMPVVERLAALEPLLPAARAIHARADRPSQRFAPPEPRP